MVQEAHRPRRRNMLAETRLLSEWLLEHYEGREWLLQFRVGPTQNTPGVDLRDEAERNLVRSFNRKVDAIVVPPPDLVVIEACMWRATEKVGRLQEYLLLLRGTPEWAQWRPYPLTPILLTAQDDAVARVLAERAGLRYVFWEPEWIDDFYAAYPGRRRRAPHAGAIRHLAAEEDADRENGGAAGAGD